MIEVRELKIPIGIRSLRTANLYVISNGNKNALIDTGMSTDTMEFLKKNGIDVDGINEIMLTHLHFDHIGGAATLQKSLSVRVNMGKRDAEIISRMVTDPDGYLKNEVSYLKYLGLPESEIDIAAKVNPVKETYREAAGIDEITPVDESSTLLGFPEISILDVPGHTPGSTALVVKNQNLVFTGDHVIERITPNISYYDDDSDMLGMYLKSLLKLESTGIQTGYSGHGPEISNLAYRIDDLLSHHKLRLAEINDQCDEWRTPFEISGRIRWNRGRTLKDMNGMERIFALGETLAHLRHLEKIGLISKSERSGKLVYKK
jgi:glyoxylase-like metal-dependent hydrolase (beta-lactamase superfamily II)